MLCAVYTVQMHLLFLEILHCSRVSGFDVFQREITQEDASQLTARSVYS